MIASSSRNPTITCGASCDNFRMSCCISSVTLLVQITTVVSSQAASTFTWIFTCSPPRYKSSIANQVLLRDRFAISGRNLHMNGLYCQLKEKDAAKRGA